MQVVNLTKIAARRGIKNVNVIEVQRTQIIAAVIGTEGTPAISGEVTVDPVVLVVVEVTDLMAAHSMVPATHLQITPLVWTGIGRWQNEWVYELYDFLCSPATLCIPFFLLLLRSLCLFQSHAAFFPFPFSTLMEYYGQTSAHRTMSFFRCLDPSCVVLCIFIRYDSISLMICSPSWLIFSLMNLQSFLINSITGEFAVDPECIHRFALFHCSPCFELNLFCTSCSALHKSHLDKTQKMTICNLWLVQKIHGKCDSFRRPGNFKICSTASSAGYRSDPRQCWWAECGSHRWPSNNSLFPPRRGFHWVVKVFLSAHTWSWWLSVEILWP